MDLLTAQVVVVIYMTSKSFMDLLNLAALRVRYLGLEVVGEATRCAIEREMGFLLLSISCRSRFSPLALPLIRFCITEADLLLLPTEVLFSFEAKLLLDLALLVPSITTAPLCTFSSFFATFNRSLLTRPACILPNAD